MQFDLDRNIDAAAQDVQAAINAASGQLPRPAEPADLSESQSGGPADPDRGSDSDMLPLTQVDDFADNMLAQQISQIVGVAQVTIGGEQKPAVRVRSTRPSSPRWA